MSEQFSIFLNPIGGVIALLNTALEGKGSVAIHASGRGIRASLNGKTIVKGKTPTEFYVNLKKRQEEAVAALEKNKA